MFKYLAVFSCVQPLRKRSLFNAAPKLASLSSGYSRIGFWVCMMICEMGNATNWLFGSWVESNIPKDS